MLVNVTIPLIFTFFFSTVAYAPARPRSEAQNAKVHFDEAADDELPRKIPGAPRAPKGPEQHGDIRI